MNHIRIASMALGLSALSLVSCQKDTWLNPQLTTAISDATAFDTRDRIAQQINSLYAAVKSGLYLGSRYIAYNEIRGDDYNNLRTNGVTGFQTWNHTIVASTNEVANVWGAAYSAINQANVFLDGMAAKGSTVVGSPLANQYIAEARFIRAMCYYDLLQLYARPFWDGNGSKPGLPLRLKGNKSSGNNDLARSTVAEVYNQILQDLDFAEQNLPANYADALTNTTRAHRNTAIALKVRVNLSMQRYAQVIAEANKIVSTAAPFTAATGVAHALQASIRTVFTTYTTTESIFSLPFTANNLPGTQNSLAFHFAPAPVGGSEYPLISTGIISRPEFRADDRRRTELLTVNSGNTWINKYPTGPVNTDYAPIIRYSEVLLSLAESIARTTTGVDARALALLNAVHLRSQPTAFAAGDFATNDAFRNAILMERRIELMGEGRRSPDLLRLGLPLPAKANVQAIQPSQAEYIWPIPDTELINNKLMTQN
ncbi:MAG: RagB/SusD family nutrient uptake outer membrane protein [Chitinophagia bacterium]|nr:RagB/SusD family nutrient uptake outer membrane protein [Chitinophagia bacterium]